MTDQKVNWNWERFSFTTPNKNWYLQQVRETFARYIPPATKVLEIGCGSGNILTYLAKVKKCDAYGIDLSPEARSIVKKYEKMRDVKVHFKVASGFKIPYKAAAFDCVYSEGVIEHFSDKQILKMVREHARVCKRGGRVIISVPNTYNIGLTIAKAVLHDEYPHYPEKSHTVSQLKALMEQSGLTPIAQDGFAWQQGFAFWRFIKKSLYFTKYLPDASLPPLIRSIIGHQCLVVAIK